MKNNQQKPSSKGFFAKKNFSIHPKCLINKTFSSSMRPLGQNKEGTSTLRFLILTLKGKKQSKRIWAAIL